VLFKPEVWHGIYGVSVRISLARTDGVPRGVCVGERALNALLPKPVLTRARHPRDLLYPSAGE
jgi:hypothetical protein